MNIITTTIRIITIITTIIRIIVIIINIIIMTQPPNQSLCIKTFSCFDQV